MSQSVYRAQCSLQMLLETLLRSWVASYLLLSFFLSTESQEDNVLLIVPAFSYRIELFLDTVKSVTKTSLTAGMSLKLNMFYQHYFCV